MRCVVSPELPDWGKLRPGRLRLKQAACTFLALLSVGQSIEFKPVVQLSAVEVGMGTADWPLRPQRPPTLYLEARLLELAGGVRIGRHAGVCVGTELFRYWDYDQFTAFPLRLTVFSDFTPETRWHRVTAYATASWIPAIQCLDNWTSTAVGVGAGIGYTWYFITPRLEFNYIKAFAVPEGYQSTFPLATFGISLGGTYVIGASRPGRAF